jgi:hypothetical protein
MSDNAHAINLISSSEEDDTQENDEVETVGTSGTENLTDAVDLAETNVTNECAGQANEFSTSSRLALNGALLNDTVELKHIDPTTTEVLHTQDQVAAAASATAITRDKKKKVCIQLTFDMDYNENQDRFFHIASRITALISQECQVNADKLTEIKFSRGSVIASFYILSVDAVKHGEAIESTLKDDSSVLYKTLVKDYKYNREKTQNPIKKIETINIEPGEKKYDGSRNTDSDNNNNNNIFFREENGNEDILDNSDSLDTQEDEEEEEEVDEDADDGWVKLHPGHPLHDTRVFHVIEPDDFFSSKRDCYTCQNYLTGDVKKMKQDTERKCEIYLVKFRFCHPDGGNVRGYVASKTMDEADVIRCEKYHIFFQKMQRLFEKRFKEFLSDGHHSNEHGPYFVQNERVKYREKLDKLIDPEATYVQNVSEAGGIQWTMDQLVTFYLDLTKKYLPLELYQQFSDDEILRYENPSETWRWNMRQHVEYIFDIAAEDPRTHKIMHRISYRSNLLKNTIWEKYLAKFHEFVTDKYKETDELGEEKKQIEEQEKSEEEDEGSFLSPKRINNNSAIKLISSTTRRITRSGSFEDNYSDGLLTLLRQLKRVLKDYQDAVQQRTNTVNADFGVASTLVEHINMFVQDLKTPGKFSLVLFQSLLVC